MKNRVAVVDDHTLLSEAIAGLVRQFPDFEVVAVYKNGKELLNYLKNSKKHPNIVLMDVNMPVMNGIETTLALSKDFPEIKVIALSIEEDEQIILKMIRAGAKGYLLKDTQKEVLKQALIDVEKVGFYHTNTVKKILKSAENNPKKEIILKEREIEFLKLACTEMTYKEIADVMCLSPKTVEGYREALFQKLNVKNRTGLVLYAIKNNIFIP
ncbi:response regulator [Leeuwenhoekiella sp. A16]|uniref:response regulator n=1 Tax=unclassified Leeuwenhoekiella TaxID=2615029 RepID=UPI003A80FC1A